MSEKLYINLKGAILSWSKCFIPWSTMGERCPKMYFGGPNSAQLLSSKMAQQNSLFWTKIGNFPKSAVWKLGWKFLLATISTAHRQHFLFSQLGSKIRHQRARSKTLVFTKLAITIARHNFIFKLSLYEIISRLLAFRWTLIFWVTAKNKVRRGKIRFKYCPK